MTCIECGSTIKEGKHYLDETDPLCPVCEESVGRWCESTEREMRAFMDEMVRALPPK